MHQLLGIIIKDYSYASIKMDSLFPKVGHYTHDMGLYKGSWH